ncbi:hypothetical protein IR010_02920 [Flavobacterium sp. MR2016-29]|uniref:hypothetical protein n=1 Tax=Flavobacterium sp. MR2016-29 TaxID=2783795 RepID=UPI00188B4ED8|nr:hypothetical protein [Flavobacterium sp. MR2016-29]MBF4491478.1 hypothetical protein [Flavobacterium sp. MR2016-29]
MTNDFFKLLRKQFRLSGKTIVDHIKRNHFEPGNFGGKDDICSFCSRNDKLTNEHVLPRWSFQNDPMRYFKTVINGTSQNYIKTVIPPGQICNNETLAKVENKINGAQSSQTVFENTESIALMGFVSLGSNPSAFR